MSTFVVWQAVTWEEYLAYREPDDGDQPGDDDSEGGGETGGDGTGEPDDSTGTDGPDPDDGGDLPGGPDEPDGGGSEPDDGTDGTEGPDTEDGTDGGTDDEDGGGGEPTAPPSISQRTTSWFDYYNLAIKKLAERPDLAASQTEPKVVYLIKDVFTTRFGSWEPGDQPGDIPQWARDDYLKAVGSDDYFDDAGGDHHLFAAVIGLDGDLIRQNEILYWSDGFDALADPDYGAFVRRLTKSGSGWANIVIGPGSSYVPERDETGPWSWAPVGAAEVITGGGLPANQHISTFVVWQAVEVKEPDDSSEDDGEDGGQEEPDGHTTYLPNVSGGSAEADKANSLPDSMSQPDLPALHGLRQAAWNRIGLELDSASVLAPYARKLGLGMPVTAEFDVHGYRLQGYQQGIVYVQIGDWQNVTHMSW